MSANGPRFGRTRLALKGLTPPFLWDLLKRLKDAVRGRPASPPAPASPAPPPEWEYVPEGWARPARGWEVDAIARVYRKNWPSFLEAASGPGLLGVNHEVPEDVPVPRSDLDAQQHVLAFAYALARAAEGKQRLSLLDWGGGPGHFAVLARALFPELDLDYHSRDLPALAELGRELLPGDSFHADDACLEGRYDLVVASSSLQYSEDWRAVFSRLAAATSRYIYITRVPVTFHSPSFVVLQRAQAYGYETEYLGWVLSRDELLAAAQDVGLPLVRELVLPARLSVAGAPEDPIEHRGFLFAAPPPRMSRAAR